MKVSLRTMMLMVMSFAVTAAFLAPHGDQVTGASYALLLFMLMLTAYSATGASIACDKRRNFQSAMSGILVGFFLACGLVWLAILEYAPQTSP